MMLNAFYGVIIGLVALLAATTNQSLMNGLLAVSVPAVMWGIHVGIRWFRKKFIGKVNGDG